MVGMAIQGVPDSTTAAIGPETTIAHILKSPRVPCTGFGNRKEERKAPMMLPCRKRYRSSRPMAGRRTSGPARVMPMVYADLRRLADAYSPRNDRITRLQATGLVHEAYIRLVTAARL